MTPMASRVDFWRQHRAEAGVAVKDRRRSGVHPEDALRSNPTLASTLDGAQPVTSPITSDKSSWNRTTLYSPG